jgi:uncharacterized coiled-coil DUF342 family protein
VASESTPGGAGETAASNLGARLASAADISDTPPTKTRIAFNVTANEADIKSGFLDLVNQFNHEWKGMTERVESLEKFETNFTQQTLPTIHQNTAEVTNLKAKVEHIPENLGDALQTKLTEMQLSKDLIDAAYTEAKKLLDDIKANNLEGKFQELIGTSEEMKTEVKVLQSKYVETINNLKDHGSKFADISNKNDEYIAQVVEGKVAEQASRVGMVESALTANSHAINDVKQRLKDIEGHAFAAAAAGAGDGGGSGGLQVKPPKFDDEKCHECPA